MMFVELGYTAKAIAETLGVQENSVGKWRKDGGWDKQREELLASPHKIRQLLLKEYQSIADGNDPKLNADAISKISKALDSIDDKINPRVVISFLKMLDDFTANIDPVKAASNLDVHKLFILHMIEMYG